MTTTNQEAVNALSGSAAEDTDGPAAKRFRHQVTMSSFVLPSPRNQNSLQPIGSLKTFRLASLSDLPCCRACLAHSAAPVIFALWAGD